MDLVKTEQKIISILTDVIPNYEDDFWSADTELFGAIAEFDSMAIVNIIGEIEEQFDITFDDDDISAENFTSVASLAELVFNYSR
jgi:acyl carrier protein